MLFRAGIDYVVWVVVILSAFVGAGVFLRDRAARSHRWFAAFVAALNLWILANFLENEPSLVGEGNLALFLRLDFLFAIWIVYSWFRFCVHFTGSTIDLRAKWLTPTLLSLAGALSLLSLGGPLVIARAAFVDGLIRFAAGPLLSAYAGLIILLAAAGLVLLILAEERAHASGNRVRAQQINLILAGFFVSIGNAIVINLFLQPFYNISLALSRFGLYGMTVLTFATGYAILRHRLFEVRFVIVRAVGFLILLGAVGIVYVAAIFFFPLYLFDLALDPRLLIGGIVLTTIVAMTSGYIRTLTGKLTRRLFFKGEYDAAELLSRLTHIMAETIDLDAITGKILASVTAEMEVTKAAFVIVDKRKILKVRAVGFSEDAMRSLPLEELFGPSLRNKVFVFEELQEGALKDLFRALDISAIVPIRVEAMRVALFVLGPRPSGEAYYARDVGFLDTFASTAGLAIQNAKTYEELKRFNRELEEIVESRTKELKATQERELAKARDIARLKDEFVFIAAHELRTPVTAIRGFLELISDSTGTFTKDVRENLEAIRSASENLSQLINDLLEIARSESGTLSIEVGLADVVPVMGEVVKELAPLAEQAAVVIEWHPGEVQHLARIDARKAKEVFLNLVSNAIKYNRSQGFVRIALAEADGKVAISVQDNGYGIPERHKDKIFQKFFRAKATGTEDVLGTGLGLFVSRMLVEKMGGTIRFRSEEGRGSTFTVSFSAGHAGTSS